MSEILKWIPKEIGKCKEAKKKKWDVFDHFFSPPLEILQIK